jgi:hypothetical protein
MLHPDVQAISDIRNYSNITDYKETLAEALWDKYSS